MKTEGYRIKEYRQPVKRYCQTLDLNGDSELIAKYREAHDKQHFWHEIGEGIRQVGILEMEIYILGNRLVMIVETPLDFQWDEAMARHPTPTGRVGSLRGAISRLLRRRHLRREMADNGAHVPPLRISLQRRSVEQLLDAFG